MFMKENPDRKNNVSRINGLDLGFDFAGKRNLSTRSNDLENAFSMRHHGRGCAPYSTCLGHWCLVVVKSLYLLSQIDLDLKFDFGRKTLLFGMCISRAITAGFSGPPKTSYWKTSLL